MKFFSNVCHTLCVISALVLVGCVDESYRIDEVSTEVTLVQGETTLPLGSLERMTLDDLMKETEVEGLKKDENGNYTFSFGDKGEPISVEGVTTSFKIPETGSSFNIEFPEFNLAGERVSLTADQDLVVNVDALADYMPQGKDEYELLDLGFDYPSFTGHYLNTFDSEDAHLHFNVPAQIDEIHKIYFKDIETGHHGAPMHIEIDLNDMADINGGGKVWLDLSIAGGSFTLLDTNNEVIHSGNNYKEEYEFISGEDTVKFVIYIESITNEVSLDANHELDLPLELTCDVNFEIKAKPGTFSLKDKPHIALNADFEFGDAEVVLNKDTEIIDYGGDNALDIEIKAIPEQIERINVIGIESTELEFYAHGLEWLSEADAAVEVVVTLPSYLQLHSLDNVDYEYNNDSHQITTSVAAITEGLKIGLDALDFGAEGIMPDENGTIKLSFAPTVKAHFATDEDVKISTLIPDNNDIHIEMGIKECDIELQYVSGVVDYKYNLVKEFNITGVDDLKGLQIEGVGLKPVLKINVENPLTVDANLMFNLKTNDGRELTIGSEAEPLVIKSATVDNGVVTPVKTSIVLATEDVSSQYSDAICIVCDIDKLLKGRLPSSIAIALDFWTNTEEMTLYVGDEFVINYDYSLELPIELNSETKLIYEQTLDFEEMGVENPFESLGELESIKVGDVALMVNVATTLPLELVASVDMIDAQGDVIDGLVALPEGGNSIKGSEDGVTVAESTLRLELHLDGSISKLADVAGISFRVEAGGVDNEDAPLSDEQYLEAKLQLQLSGGVTADLKELGVL